MEILEKIADLLEELGYEFDYILNDGERVAVVRALCSGNRILFEEKDLFSLLSILERKKVESFECVWCRDN